MIVDVHTHTPTHREAVPPNDLRVQAMWRPDRPVTPTCSWADYLAGTRPASRSIVFGMAFPPGVDSETMTGIPYPPGTDINELTAEFVAAHPDRLIGFLSVYPDHPLALREIDRGVRELRLRGIKLGPNYQNFDPLSSPAMAIYARAEELGVPVLFHQGTSPVRTAPIRYAHPLVMDEIAIAFPRLPVIMAHMGHPWQADCIVVIRKHPHLYADVSGLFYRPWSLYNCLRLAAEWNVMSKLLLGSDFPITTCQETIDGLRRVNRIIEGTALPPVPEEQIEGIIERDSLALLGLDR
ncbi:MAG: amidohydrolase [Armatimonadetes bacterium]|nr:amidohydrolase [Armatimonadota bacterium]